MAHLNQKPTRTVFVGNIGPDVTEHVLSEIFSPIGALKSIRIVLEKDTGISKGYAFCAYYDIANAESAIRNLSNREINGRPMRLGYAQDYAFKHEDQAGAPQGVGLGLPQQQQAQQQLPALQHRPQGMLPEHPMQYLTQAAPPAPAPIAPMAASAGHDQISSTLARMSRPELYNILAQMKALIEQNSAQARQILVQNPQLTKALFQAQVILGMVQGAPLLQASPPPPAQHTPLAFPVQQQLPQQYMAQAPAVLAGAYANGGLGSVPNGFSASVQAPVANYAAPLQAQQQPQPATPVYSQQQQQQQQQQQAPAYLQQQQGPPPPQQMQAQPQMRPAQQYALPQAQQQQPLQQDAQPSAAAATGQPQGPQPDLGADQQRALLEQVMKLTPQQIDLLPPQQKAQVIALQQQMSQFR